MSRTDKPIIGILPAVDAKKTTRLLHDYTKAIEQAGGIPLPLPYTAAEDTLARLTELCRGFLLMGGADLSPTLYGEEPLPVCGEISLPFDDLSVRVLKRILPTQKPILGICRGAQLINAVLGGALYQDLPTQFPSPISHRQTEETYERSHMVQLTEGTPLHRLLKEDRIQVNSFHHQAIKRLAPELRVMARADDGVIEAAYLPSHPYLYAIQWHPERLYSTDKHSQQLFRSLIEAAERTAIN